MAVEFKISQETPKGKPDISVLHLNGWLDVHSEENLVAAVRNAREAGAEYVLLELSGVDTITSAGIRAIQKSFALMTPKDETMLGRLKLCSAVPQVYEVLSMTGMLISVPMYESQDIAVESFGK